MVIGGGPEVDHLVTVANVAELVVGDLQVLAVVSRGLRRLSHWNELRAAKKHNCYLVHSYAPVWLALVLQQVNRSGSQSSHDAGFIALPSGLTPRTLLRRRESAESWNQAYRAT